MNVLTYGKRGREGSRDFFFSDGVDADGNGNVGNGRGRC